MRTLRLFLRQVDANAAAWNKADLPPGVTLLSAPGHPCQWLGPVGGDGQTTDFGFVFRRTEHEDERAACFAFRAMMAGRKYDDIIFEQEYERYPKDVQAFARTLIRPRLN